LTDFQRSSAVEAVLPVVRLLIEKAILVPKLHLSGKVQASVDVKVADAVTEKGNRSEQNEYVSQ
jgi:hypothetical protein